MSDIICPQCGTESPYQQLISEDNPQCTICGKLLIAETLRMKQKLGKSAGIDSSLVPSDGLNTREMGRKLSQLGDDDLFGDLDPFDLDDEENKTADDDLLDDMGELGDLTDDFLDDENDNNPRFKNPMEKSNLMKKLKDDHDLFGSLDE